jgi:hypothetical protein
MVWEIFEKNKKIVARDLAIILGGAMIHHDGATPVTLADERFCRGCPHNPPDCEWAFTSRIPDARQPAPLGALICDWRRGHGCPLVRVPSPSKSNPRP